MLQELYKVQKRYTKRCSQIKRHANAKKREKYFETVSSVLIDLQLEGSTEAADDPERTVKPKTKAIEAREILSKVLYEG